MTSRFDSYQHRAPAVRGILRFLEYGHLTGSARDVSEGFAELAERLLNQLPDDPELSVALRKLREAKDCAVGLAAVTDKSVDC